MAVSTSVTLGPEVPGNRKESRGTITFASSYPTGGEAVVVADLGFTRLDWLHVAPGNGYMPVWDGSTTNPKVLMYRQSAASSALTEVPNTTDLSATSIKFFAVGA